jgi:hypothetical protein
LTATNPSTGYPTLSRHKLSKHNMYGTLLAYRGGIGRAGGK